jgi:uncharacterized protein YbjQ (UPF0145 family)
MTGRTQPAPAPARVPVATELELHDSRAGPWPGLGLVVRSTRAIKTMGERVKAMRQGEVTQYTELLEDSRRHAIDPMIENARLLRATAVVAVWFDSSEIGQQLTEVVAYGTTVAARPAG